MTRDASADGPLQESLDVDDARRRLLMDLDLYLLDRLARFGLPS